MNRNKNGWEKDPDARRWRRCIDDRRRGIDSLPIAIIRSTLIAFVVISRPPVLVTAVVMFPHFFVIFA